jgi:hypothetical protein
MPFRQYVFNNSLASAINDVEIREIAELQAPDGDSGQYGDRLSLRDRSGLNHTLATGTVVIDLGIGGQEGQRFLSQEIAHGLGLGPVTILLGEAYTESDDADLIFGDPDIFEDVRSSPVADVRLGARANITKGTFIVGARVVTPTNARKLKVNWTAIRDSKENIHDLESRRIFIKPDMADVEVRESCYFEAIFANVADKRIKWKVKEAEGGTIDGNGMYTAPNIPGVFEIIAESLAYPELRASTYVVVRETPKE